MPMVAPGASAASRQHRFSSFAHCPAGPLRANVQRGAVSLRRRLRALRVARGSARPAAECLAAFAQQRQQQPHHVEHDTAGRRGSGLFDQYSSSLVGEN